MNEFVANSNDTANMINVSVLNPSKESRFNTLKLLDLYGNMEDSLKSILKERERYYNDDPVNSQYKTIINTYDSAQSYKETDIDLHDALIATCYYQIYKNISSIDEDPLLMFDEVIDSKGDTKQKLNYNKLADSLIRKYCIISHNEIPYLYIGTQYYSDANRKRLKKDITKILKVINYSDHSKVTDISKDIIDRIINSTHKLKDFPFNKLSSEFIPVSNGMVDRRALKLLPTSPVFRMMYHLNADFNPNLDPKPINDYLNSLVENPEDADLILQIPAQALLQKNHQLAYVFTGEGQNGKSAFLTFLENFIGEENYTSASLQELTENRFAKAELEGKLLNIYSDLNKGAIKYSGIFKNLTGGDEINCERKFGQPFKLRNKAVLAFAANELPEVTDATFAFWRRWCVIPFPHKFELNPEFIPNLMTKDNMSIFLNLVINKMNRIETQGLTKSNRVDEACHMWKVSSSSAYAFVYDCINKKHDGKIQKPILEDLYIAYCEEKDTTKQDFKNVVTELQKLGVITSRTRNSEGKLVYVYNGCEYKKHENGVKYTQNLDDEPIPELKTFEEEPKSI